MKQLMMKGFTLVELMVAIGLSSFLLLGAFQVFDANFRSYNLVISDSYIQDTTRIARAIITKDIHLADNLGCKIRLQDYDGDAIFGSKEPVPSGANPNVTNPQFDLIAFDGVLLQDNIVADQKISSLVDFHSANDNRTVEEGTDVLTLSRATGFTQQLIAHSSSNAASHSVTITGREFSRGDYLLIRSCTGQIQSEIFEVLDVVSVGKNQLLTVNKPVYGTYAIDGQQLMATSFYRIEAVSYFISQSVTSSQKEERLSLFRKVNNQPSQEFLAGVDDLQVTYEQEQQGGVGFSGSSISRGALLPPSMLMLNLVVRSDQTESQIAFAGPESGKTSGDVYGDKRLRRLVGFSAKLRNKS
ncbi:MAG: prepilin-type N-terminal cleavage/methylation domain-containing protein [Cellvibrionales bacterium]|nr:prepilin-type N-terminal cleavage/methylation domain-containing protein [Cellvibrionales bacterium]